MRCQRRRVIELAERGQAWPTAHRSASAAIRRSSHSVCASAIQASSAPAASRALQVGAAQQRILAAAPGGAERRPVLAPRSASCSHALAQPAARGLLAESIEHALHRRAASTVATLLRSTRSLQPGIERVAFGQRRGLVERRAGRVSAAIEGGAQAGAPLRCCAGRRGGSSAAGDSAASSNSGRETSMHVGSLSDGSARQVQASGLPDARLNGCCTRRWASWPDCLPACSGSAAGWCWSARWRCCCRPRACRPRSAMHAALATSLASVDPYRAGLGARARTPRRGAVAERRLAGAGPAARRAGSAAASPPASTATACAGSWSATACWPRCSWLLDLPRAALPRDRPRGPRAPGCRWRASLIGARLGAWSASAAAA